MQQSSPDVVKVGTPAGTPHVPSVDIGAIGPCELIAVDGFQYSGGVVVFVVVLVFALNSTETNLVVILMVGFPIRMMRPPFVHCVIPRYAKHMTIKLV